MRRPNFKELKGEDIYCEFTEEESMYGVFDTKYGFCWGLHFNLDQAKNQVSSLRKYV